MPVPYDGEIFTFTNPDGGTVDLRGWGNQFSAVFETLDGYTVLRSPESGYYEYAVPAPDGAGLRPSGLVVGASDPESLSLTPHLRPARSERLAEVESRMGPGTSRRWEQRRAERLAQSRRGVAEGALAAPGPSMDVTGSMVGLCVLVQFPDVPGTLTRDQVQSFCNQVGYSDFGNAGSVRDYFSDVSGGRLTYTNVVTAYYTAAHPRAHYTDESIPQGQRARELILEAVQSLEDDGFDFSGLSADSSGFVYALNVFYAGPVVNNWAQGLWPHQWSLASPRQVAPGKKLYDYQITNTGSSLTLRTFCHENGHMIGSFPDLYDYGGESNGVGHYSLMCFGGSNTNPTQVDGYLKFEAGWADTVTEVAPGGTYTLPSDRNDLLLHRKNDDEFFVMENRRRTGRDAALPDEGLAIWHCDRTGNNSFEQMTPAKHYLLSLEQADGAFHLENGTNAGDGADLYGGVGASTFGVATTPSSAWWDGSDSSLDVVSVSAPGPAITVSLAGGDAVPSGTYTIRQVSSGRFVDAHEHAGEDFRLVTRTAQNNDTQRWAFTQVGAVYTMAQVSSERFVDAHEHAGEDFRLVTRTAQNNDTQRWVLMPVPERPCTYTIQQLSSGRFVDAHEHAGEDFRLVTRTAQSNDTQRWLFTPQGADDVFTVQQLSSGRFVDAHEHAGEDFRLVTRTAQDNDTQRWRLSRVAMVYRVRQVSSGRFVDAHEHAGEDFRLVTRTAQDNDTQLWVVSPVGGDGTFTIQQLSSARFVDAHENAGQDFRVVTRAAQHNDTQRWRIDPA